ncbi:unnamed protein product [Caretta caretta]
MGHKYILIIVDYTTRYPEAVPLWTATAPAIANELLKIFARIGQPHEILTDQGTNVTLRLMAELCPLLNIHAFKTPVYHPQIEELVEWFNGTLKSMMEDNLQHWDKLLPALLSAVREVPQASTGLFLFELLYGRQPQGILDLLRET